MLDGDLAEAGRATVRAIAEDIAQLPRERRRPADEALFWAYVAGTFDDPDTTSRFEAAITAFHERLEMPFSSLGLYNGLAGAGWVLAHISDDSANEALEEIDRALIDGLGAPWAGGHDLIQGLTGLGVYFLERLRTGAATARAGVACVVEQLAATAEARPEGATWLTPPEQLPAWQRVWAPAGHYDVGVAHGAPGAIALLAAVAVLEGPELASTAGQARALCEGAGRWLQKQRLAPDPRGWFPTTIPRDPRVPERARTAWCYGDPGVAIAMWSAAVRTGTDPAEWRELALEAAARPAAQCGVEDAGLCHGAVGLAHLCNRFFQASGDERFRRASLAWFEQALAMRRPGEGIGGFTVPRWIDVARGQPPVREAAADFLEGGIGIGLALLAGLAAEEPGWDRLLLCDLPPRQP